MGKLIIPKMMDVLIVEKYDSEKLLKGSNIFCGCCGKSVGVLKKDVKIPFRSDGIIKSLSSCSIEHGIFGCRHKTCGHTMFSFKKSWDFTSLEAFIKADGKYVEN